MIFRRLGVTVFILAVVVLSFSGCSLFQSLGKTQTRIIPVKFGSIEQLTQFKAGIMKPHTHIIWGDDVRDGAHCKITISNISKAKLVYRRDFEHDEKTDHDNYNYERGKIVELDPNWYNQIGSYLLELYIDGRRKSRISFAIVP